MIKICLSVRGFFGLNLLIPKILKGLKKYSMVYFQNFIYNLDKSDNSL